MSAGIYEAFRRPFDAEVAGVGPVMVIGQLKRGGSVASYRVRSPGQKDSRLVAARDLIPARSHPIDDEQLLRQIAALRPLSRVAGLLIAQRAVDTQEESVPLLLAFAEGLDEIASLMPSPGSFQRLADKIRLFVPTRHIDAEANSGDEAIP